MSRQFDIDLDAIKAKRRRGRRNRIKELRRRVRHGDTMLSLELTRLELQEMRERIIR